MSSKIAKELNGNLTIIQKRRHNHCELAKTFNVEGEDGSRIQNEPLESSLFVSRMIQWILTSLIMSQ